MKNSKRKQNLKKITTVLAASGLASTGAFASNSTNAYMDAASRVVNADIERNLAHTFSPSLNVNSTLKDEIIDEIASSGVNSDNVNLNIQRGNLPILIQYPQAQPSANIPPDQFFELNQAYKSANNWGNVIFVVSLILCVSVIFIITKNRFWESFTWHPVY
jgi:hypothetical protein